MPIPKKILFVCLGNIVRSPLAENLFIHLTKETEVARNYRADSCGTGGYHTGDAPDARMCQVAAGRGFHYTGQARQFRRTDFDDFDIIIPMDMGNRNTLFGVARSPEDKAKIHLMREFDPQATNPQAPVPDPYYGGIDGFENVYDIVERSCRGLLDALESGDLG